MLAKPALPARDKTAIAPIRVQKEDSFIATNLSPAVIIILLLRFYVFSALFTAAPFVR
jgi:hypothetical protein